MLNKKNVTSFKATSKRPRAVSVLQSNQIFKISPKRQISTDSESSPDEDDKFLIRNWGFPEEITRFYRFKGIDRFFPWQVEALEQPGVLENYQNLVYSAPTSAGKTMVSDVLLYKNILERKKKAIIILPFVSITVEKVETLKKLLKRIGVKIDKFAGNSNPKGGLARVDVAVCTIEKANNMINRLIEEGNLSDIGLIIVDELHMLGDSSRGYLLELLLTKILYHSKRSGGSENLVQIVGMSATIPNLPDIARWLDAELYITDYRPVPLFERLVEVIGKDVPSILIEHDKSNADGFKLLPSIDVRELQINHEDAPLIFTAIETVIEGFSALIFCPTKIQCEKFSRDIAFHIYEFGAKKKLQNPRVKELGEKIVDKIRLNTEKIIKLMESLKKSSAGLDPQLEESLRFGVAFHHAGMSTDERAAVEEAFRNNVVKILCSTTTLSAGVNLPARRVLITSPFNYRGDQLLDVITYRQMIGRAGRKGIDELGESYTFCRSKDVEQAKSLVLSDIKPIKSCLLRLQTNSSNSEDSNSGSSDSINIVMSESLKKAIIEIISNGTASNRADVIEYCKCTFFNESFRSRLSEEEKVSGSHFEAAIDQVLEYLSSNQLVYFNNNPDSDSLQTRIYVSNLGKAIVASGILPDDGQFIQKELDRARNNLSLINDLHLVYQVTPTYISNQLDSIDWRYYLDLWEKLSREEKSIGEKIGITTHYLVSRCNSTLNLNNRYQVEKYQIHKRFYASLALHDLIQEIPLLEVAQKYRLVKGQIQSLQQQAATFAGMLATFCNKLGWFSMELLIDQFQPRLAFGVQRELIDLMRITFLPTPIARSLYKNYQTLTNMVYERYEDIEKCIIQGIAFDSNEDIDPKSKLIFIPALENHFTVSEFARKVLDEARDIIQAEVGQTLIFESNETETLSNIRISPIKVKPSENKTVAETYVPSSSSTPVSLERKIENNKESPNSSYAYEKLFEDDFEFSFGATPSKHARIEKAITKTPSSNNKIISKKEKSTKKLIFSSQSDLLQVESNNHHEKVIEKGDNVENDSARINVAINSPQKSKSSDIHSDVCDEFLNNSLNNLSWSEMLDQVKDYPKDIVCLTKTNNDNDDITISSNELIRKENLSDLSTNPLIISPRMDPLLSSTELLHTESLNHPSSSFTFDDSDEYSKLFSNDHANPIDFIESDDKKVIKIETESSSSFEFDEEFSQEELDTLVNNPRISINQSDIFDDNSCSSLDFFETFNKKTIFTLPECFDKTAIELDNLSLVNVENDEQLEIMFNNFVNNNSLRLNFHFNCKPYSENVSIINRASSSKSRISNLFLQNSSNGIIIRDGNPFEITELYFSSIGESTVFRIDNEDIFIKFIHHFRQLLSRIEPLFEDCSRSPYSVKSQFSDASGNILITTYNVKLCMHIFVRAFKLPLKVLITKIRWFDLQVAVWLLDPEANYFTIDNLTIQNLMQITLNYSVNQAFIQKVQLYQISKEKLSGKNIKKKNMNSYRMIKETPETGLLKTILLPNLVSIFCKRLLEQDLYKSYILIEIPARLCFASMEMKGIQFNEIMLEYENRRLKKFQNFLSKKIFKIVGKEFNLNSADQVANVLFQDQSLLTDYFSITQTFSMNSNKKIPKFSTNKLALIKLQQACGTKTNLPTLIIEWRRLHYTLGCINSIKQSIRDDGFVYCQLEEWTATGRIAMHETKIINFDKDYEITSISTEIEQKIMNFTDSDDEDFCDESNSFLASPTKQLSNKVSKPVKIKIRKTLVARQGYCLISADYSQLELRVLAHFAKDPELRATLNDPSSDVFKSIASRYLNIEVDQVSFEARQQVKQICYGIIYGMGNTRLAEALAITVDEAKQFKLSFMQKYSKIDDFIDKTIDNLKINGYIEMISHRRRLLPNIHSNDETLLSKARRQATHSVIQGSAADCIKLAMIAVDSAIRKSGFDASLILQIHDELMYEVRNDDTVDDQHTPIEFARLLKNQMENVSKHLKVILPVKVQTGSSWGDLTELKDL